MRIAPIVFSLFAAALSSAGFCGETGEREKLPEDHNGVAAKYPGDSVGHRVHPAAFYAIAGQMARAAEILATAGDLDGEWKILAGHIRRLARDSADRSERRVE